MNIKKMIQTYDTHINGVKSRIITGGVPYIPGKDIYEKANYLRDNMDQIRKFVFLKPRGDIDLSGVIITEPTSKNVDLAAIFMDGEGYENGNIEDLVGAFTVIAETGMIKMNNGCNDINLETQFGIFNGLINFENESANIIKITCPKNFEVKIKEAKTSIKQEDIKDYRAFIIGMHMFLLDSDDKICN